MKLVYGTLARYFSTEMGRFVSRDPLGYVDGLGLYNGYFAQWMGVDPLGTEFIPIVVEMPPSAIIDNWPPEEYNGVVFNGITFEVPPTLRGDDIFSYSDCCATIQEPAEYDLVALSVVPSSLRDNNNSFVYTPNGRRSVIEHEARRRRYLQLGYEAYLATYYTGTVCAESAEAAEAILRAWLAVQRRTSIQEFDRYRLQQRIAVGNETLVDGQVLIPPQVSINDDGTFDVTGGLYTDIQAQDHYEPSTIHEPTQPPESTASNSYNE